MMLIPLCKDRVRKITGSFAFLEHRFLHDGFFVDLDHDQLLLYLFLVLVGDRLGLSYYSYDKICTLLKMSVDEYIDARNALIQKDLLAFDGHLFQILSLPRMVSLPEPELLRTTPQMEKKDPATIRRLLDEAFGGANERG